MLAFEWADEKSIAELPVMHHPGRPRLPDAPIGVGQKHHSGMATFTVQAYPACKIWGTGSLHGR